MGPESLVPSLLFSPASQAAIHCPDGCPGRKAGVERKGRAGRLSTAWGRRRVKGIQPWTWTEGSQEEDTPGWVSGRGGEGDVSALDALSEGLGGSRWGGREEGQEGALDPCVCTSSPTLSSSLQLRASPFPTPLSSQLS